MNFSFLYNKRRLILFFIDFFTMLIASLFAFFVSDIFLGISVSMRLVYGSVLTLILCCLAGLWCMRVYRNIWRYATAMDFFNMIRCV